MPDWQEFLSTIPIFSLLTRAELASVQDLFQEVSYEKGDTICRIGDEGDVFYVVLSGELEVWGGSEGDRMVGTLGPRDFFGEMVMLQGGKRTATIKVARRARLLSLDKAGFERVFLINPKAIEYFARVLCKRLATTTRGEAARRATTTISIVGRPGLKGKTLVASVLAALLTDISANRVLLVEVYPGAGEARPDSVDHLLSSDLAGTPEKIREELGRDSSGVARLKIAARANLSRAVYGERASNLVSKLSGDFPYMVFDLGSEPQALIDSAGAFSDVLIEVVDKPGEVPAAVADSSVKTYEVINLFNPTSTPVPLSHCEPFVIPKDPALEGDPESAAGYIRDNPRVACALPLHRLARKLVGATVGVALGGGAAFGVAHLGVLKVLEQNHIPVDIVAGCSQGSIIGVGYAAGVAVEKMIEIALDLGKMSNFFTAMDFTLTRPGILGGNRVIEIFSPMLEEKKTFEDLLVPCRTVATDIETGERVAIGSGRLDAAFRASSSVPMVFAPLRWNERALVDGGVADPVPAEVVQQMGADLCIAVNVVPPLKRGIETVVSRLYRQLSYFNPLSYLGDSRNLPSMFDIIMNSMQILQYELGNFKAISADVLINPDLSDFTWIEYYRAEELIQRGAEAAERALPAINKAINEKLAPARRKQGVAA
ncbi:MAG: cyclic nucleotide-binding domain-containing protein [Acidobacteria bacterium]|nr:cyclic nucleotide-binding domain-containing protein [Acidobacteriota bacterium]